jgi:heptaprenylglyceryl phosphate synthase
MKNYTEVIEYIETVLNGNCIEIRSLKEGYIINDPDEAIGIVTLTVRVPLRRIPNE